MSRQYLHFSLNPLYLRDIWGIWAGIWDTFGTAHDRDIARNTGVIS